jgi:hypothetical protein
MNTQLFVNLKETTRRVASVFCLGLLCLTSMAQTSVERWGRYELTLPAKVKGNPFEVELTATFSGPDTTMVVRGFYDGNDTFKVRFMPMKTGTWNYCTQSEVAALNGVKGSLTCVAQGPENHGPVVVDGRYDFKYADGTRYYPVGTTSYDWMHQEDAQIAQTLASIKESRFNKIRMLFFVHNFDPDFPEPKLFPFEIKSVHKNKEGRPVYEWDFTRFNPQYFAHVEQCVDELAKLGVEADLILFHPYDEGRWGFDNLPYDVAVRYLQYLTSRMGAFRNVWWSLANEYDLMRKVNPAYWGDYIRTVVANDPYAHLCSIHSYTARYYSYWEPELTHTSIQDQAPVEQPGRAVIVKNIYKKPVIFDEVCYEGNMEDRWGNLSGEEMLYRMWLGLIVGTYVTHGECYMDSPTDFSRDFLAIGGKFQGEAWKRIGFTREILEALPNPLQLSDSSWDPNTSTAGENYYLVYLGKEILTDWEFSLPVRNASFPRLGAGVKFKVEVIDTWNMTVEEYPQTFETGTPTRYRVYDKNHGRVKLPAKPYLLLRITAAQ